MTQRQKVVWRNARAALVGVGLLCGSVAFAQSSTSVLTGNVVDAATKAPVADVVVTATSPSLQGEQVVVTDSTGLYRVPQLPPGTYTLRFEKETYRPYSRTAIDVEAGKQLRLNVELLPETAGATEISVVGSPPTIDVGSSSTGATISQDFAKNVPVNRPSALTGANRSFDSLATAAPQASADIYGVGVNGATSPENLYQIDGLTVNNPAYGTLGTPITQEFIDEVTVVTGGYLPEYGRTTGGAISAVTKSGGNEFHGSIFGTITPGGLAGPPASVTTSGTVQSTRDLNLVWDFGATLGGYILKDRLWFFVGVQPSYQRYAYTRDYYKVTGTDSAGNPIREFIEGSHTRRFASEKSWNYIGKLTFLLNADNRFNVSVIGTPTTGGGPGQYSPRTGSTDRAPVAAAAYANSSFNAAWFATKFDALDINGEYNGSFFDKKLLLDIRAGWHHQVDENLPGDGSGFDVTGTGLAGTPTLRTRNAENIAAIDSDVPQVVKDACLTIADCPVRRYFIGGPAFIEKLNLDILQFKGVVTYLLTAAGHHVFKAGVDININQYDHTKAYTGGAYYRYLSQTRTRDIVYEARRFGYLTNVDTISGDDTLVVHNVTKTEIIGGFIQDSWSIMDKVTLNLGLRYDALTAKGDDGVARMVLKDQLSPRVGFVWDPTQQGRSKIYASYGRYYENVPLDINDRALSSETQVQGAHNCHPLNQGRAYCDANTRNDSSANLAWGTGASRNWVPTGSTTAEPIDPDIKSPSNDEILAGAEYEVLPNARAGISYTYRNLHRTIEDMSNDNANTYFVGNPGEGIASDFPMAKRTYHAVTVQFTKNFADLWLAQVSYTWSKLTGNYDGLFRPEDGQLDPNINATFDLKALLANQDGPLSGDITHVVKIYAAKEFPITPVLSITPGAAFNANSGVPINYLGAQILYGPGQAYLLERGSGGRTPWVTTFDASIALNYRFTKDIVLTARVEGFNLFNSQRPTAVQNDYTFDSTGVIPGAKQGSVPQPFGGVCPVTATDVTQCAAGTGSLPRPTSDPTTGIVRPVVLPGPSGAPEIHTPDTNWGRPTAYQAVRQFRFSLRVTF